MMIGLIKEPFITHEAKYQSYIKVQTETKIVYSKQLYKYGDMIGLKYY